MGIRLDGTTDTISAPGSDLNLGQSGDSVKVASQVQLPTHGALSNRNLVINGSMIVAQRGTSQTSVANNSNENFQTLDRFGFQFGNNAGGACTISQSTEVPSNEGFTQSYKVDVTTADTSLADDHMIYVHQGLEAQDVRNSGWDYTSTSSYVTVSFWVKSSKAGNYCFTMRAQDVGHFYYNHTFTLVANTWKKVTHSIPGHASLVINNDSGLGIDLRWQLAIAANRNDATTGSWQSGSENTSTDIVNFFDSTSNDFYLTGVQLEVGEKATPFEHRSYGDELARCQRYYQEAGTILTTSSPDRYFVNVTLPVEMRDSPAISAGSIESGSGGSLLALYSRAGANTSKTHFYQGSDNSLITNAWFIFDDEL